MPIGPDGRWSTGDIRRLRKKEREIDQLHAWIASCVSAAVHGSRGSRRWVQGRRARRPSRAGTPEASVSCIASSDADL